MVWVGQVLGHMAWVLWGNLALDVIDMANDHHKKVSDVDIEVYEVSM